MYSRKYGKKRTYKKKRFFQTVPRPVTLYDKANLFRVSLSSQISTDANGTIAYASPIDTLFSGSPDYTSIANLHSYYYIPRVQVELYPLGDNSSLAFIVYDTTYAPGITNLNVIPDYMNHAKGVISGDGQTSLKLAFKTRPTVQPPYRMAVGAVPNEAHGFIKVTSINNVANAVYYRMIVYMWVKGYSRF